jgi:hypothetical protein
VGDDAQLVLGDPEGGQRVATPFAVHDDALEAVEDPTPEALLGRRAPRQQVVRGEDERRVVPQQPRVELRRGYPLQVHDVGGDASEPSQPQRVLEHLQGQAQSRPLEEPRREGVEELAPVVAVRRRHLSEAEAGGHELDLRTRARKRRGQRVVVGWSEGGWIGDDDAHRS